MDFIGKREELDKSMRKGKVGSSTYLNVPYGTQALVLTAKAAL